MYLVIIWMIVVGAVIYGQVHRQNRDARSGGGGGMSGQNPAYRQSGYTGNGQKAAAGGGERAKQQELKNRLQQRYGSPQTAPRAKAGQAGGYPVYRSGGGGPVSRGGGGGPVYRAGTAAAGNRPGGNGQRMQNPRSGQGDILSRAAANVRENEQDELELLMSRSGGLLGDLPGGGMPELDIPGQSSGLMRELGDLMIMGYQVRTVSARDFIAEGVEMLGRYEIPGQNGF